MSNIEPRLEGGLRGLSQNKKKNWKSVEGQLISKCLFGVFNFLQKTNQNKSHSSKIEFVRLFFGGNLGLKKSFRFCLNFTGNHHPPSFPHYQAPNNGSKFNAYFARWKIENKIGQEFPIGVIDYLA